MTNNTQNKYFDCGRYTDKPDNWYINTFANLQNLNTKEFVEYIKSFILENYKIDDKGIEVYEETIDGKKYTQYVLNADDPSLFLRNPWGYDYIKEGARLQKEALNKFIQQTDNDSFIANRKITEMMMLIAQTGNPSALQFALAKARTHHENKNHKDKCKYDILYTLDKDKIMEDCIHSDEYLKEISKERVNYDFEMREYFFYKTYQKIWFLTVCESKSEVRLSIHCNTRLQTYNTGHTFDDDYKLLEFFYDLKTGEIKTADNAINDQGYDIIPFDIDDAYTTTVETQFNFHTVDHYLNQRKHVLQHDNKTWTYISLGQQCYQFDSYITYKNNFSTELVEKSLCPLVDKKTLLELNAIEGDGADIDYYDLLMHTTQGYFFHMKKFLFNLHFAYLVKSKDLNVIYYAANNYVYNKSISFFESRRMLRHIMGVAFAKNIKFSDIKSVADLRSLLLTTSILTEIPVSLKFDEEYNYWYITYDFIDNNTANPINVTKTLMEIAQKSAYKTIPSALDMLLIKNWSIADNTIYALENTGKKSGSKKAKESLLAKKIVVEGEDGNLYLNPAFVENRVKALLETDPKIGTNSVYHYLSVVNYMDKFVAAFDNQREMTTLDYNNFMFTFAENILNVDNEMVAELEKSLSNDGDENRYRDRCEPSNLSAFFNLYMYGLLEDSDSSLANLLMYRNINYTKAVDNLKKYGFILEIPTKDGALDHSVSDRVKGNLNIQIVDAAEVYEKDIMSYFSYVEKDVVEIFNDYSIRGKTTFDVDIKDEANTHFKYNKRFISPIFDTNMKISKVIFVEVEYSELEESNRSREMVDAGEDGIERVLPADENNAIVNIFIDTINMAKKLGLPMKVACSSKRALIAYHDKLANIQTDRALDKIKSRNIYTPLRVGAKYIPAILAAKKHGYVVLENSYAITLEGKLQSNCIASYKNRVDSGDILLLSYMDEKEGRVSIELHGNGAGSYELAQVKLKGNREPSESLKAKIRKDICKDSAKVDDKESKRLQAILDLRAQGTKIGLSGLIYENINNSATNLGEYVPTQFLSLEDNKTFINMNQMSKGDDEYVKGWDISGGIISVEKLK